MSVDDAEGVENVPPSRTQPEGNTWLASTRVPPLHVRERSRPRKRPGGGVMLEAKKSAQPPRILARAPYTGMSSDGRVERTGAETGSTTTMLHSEAAYCRHQMSSQLVVRRPTGYYVRYEYSYVRRAAHTCNTCEVPEGLVQRRCFGRRECVGMPQNRARKGPPGQSWRRAGGD